MADGKGLDDIDASKYIHFADVSHVANRFPAEIESNYNETTDSFEAMNLKTDLLRGIYAYGFERPSAFQQHAIMPVIKGEYKAQNEARLDIVVARFMPDSSLQSRKATTLLRRRGLVPERPPPSPSLSSRRSTLI
jgi:hypothetical protein